MSDDLVAQLWRVYERGDKDAIRLASYAAEEIGRLRAELAAAKAEVVSAGIEAGIAKDTLDHCYKTNDALRAELAAMERRARTFEAANVKILAERDDLLEELKDARNKIRDLERTIIMGERK